MNPKIVEVDLRAIPLLTAEEGVKSQAAVGQFFRLGDQVEAAVRTADLSDYLVVIRLPGYSVMTGERFLVRGQLAEAYRVHERLERADAFDLAMGWVHNFNPCA